MTESREATVTLADRAGTKISNVTPKQLAFLDGYLTGLQALETAERNKEDKQDGEKHSSVNDTDNG